MLAIITSSGQYLVKINRYYFRLEQFESYDNLNKTRTFQKSLKGQGNSRGNLFTWRLRKGTVLSQLQIIFMASMWTIEQVNFIQPFRPVPKMVLLGQMLES